MIIKNIYFLFIFLMFNLSLFSDNTFPEPVKDTLKKEFKLNFKYSTTNYYNVAYLCGSDQIKNSLYVIDVFVKDVYPLYFHEKIKKKPLLVLFKDKQQYYKATKFDAYGVYFPDSSTSFPGTLFTYCNSGPGTIWHELMHSFLDINSNETMPDWFGEGLASFYEMGAIANDKFIEGYTNWRLPELQEVIREKKFKPLKIFLQEEDFKDEFGYSEARFFFCYLWTIDKMQSFVKSYVYELSPKYRGRELHEKTIARLEELTGKKIDQIEAELKKLALSTKKYEKLTKVKN